MTFETCLRFPGTWKGWRNSFVTILMPNLVAQYRYIRLIVLHPGNWNDPLACMYVAYCFTERQARIWNTFLCIGETIFEQENWCEWIHLDDYDYIVRKLHIDICERLISRGPCGPTPYVLIKKRLMNALLKSVWWVKFIESLKRFRFGLLEYAAFGVSDV